jgi:uncharacterized protein (DUF305 family)
MSSKTKNTTSEVTLLLAGLAGLIIGLMSSLLFRSYGPTPGGWGMMGGGYPTLSTDSTVSRQGLMPVSLDRHFIEQMIPHHEDAVSMSDLALTKAEHPELKLLAQNIKRDQTVEIGQMREWYASWYGTDVPEFAGGMMGGGMGRGMMMGALGDATDLDALKSSKSFDKEFIEQMIPHHQMAIMMAQMLLSGTDREELRTLGANIVRSQSAEIGQMREMYKSWYGK